MVRLIVFLVGLALTLVGAVLTFTPLPVGIILVFVGVTMMISVSARVRRWVMALRRRFAWFDRLLDRITQALPHRFTAPIEQTDPQAENPHADEDDVCPHDPEERKSAAPLVRRPSAHPRYRAPARRGV